MARSKVPHHDPAALPDDVEARYPLTEQPGPRSLLEFQQLFASEEQCAEYLRNIRWPAGFVCPKCGSRTGYTLATRRVTECRNGHQVSLTAGTGLHRSKLPLTLWFHAAYLVATLTPGISALQFQKQLGISRYETAFQLLHKLRSVLVAPDREPLQGEVEVDEGFIGGPEEGRPGRGAETKSLVVFGVEIVRYAVPDPRRPDHSQAQVEKMRAGRVRMNVVPDASAQTLLPWCARNLKVGSLVITDGWPAYNGLENLGYAHRRILQSAKGQKTGAYLPMVHLIVSNLKRWLLGTHKGAVLAHHLPAYLNEFTFRFNRRYWRGPAFHRALGLMVHAATWPEYGMLYGMAKGDPGAWVHPTSPANVSPKLKPEADTTVTLPTVTLPVGVS
jgi:transposase-like protein